MVAAIKQPGWIRGALGALLAAAFGVALVVVLRKSYGPRAPSRPNRPATRRWSCR